MSTTSKNDTPKSKVGSNRPSTSSTSSSTSASTSASTSQPKEQPKTIFLRKDDRYTKYDKSEYDYAVLAETNGSEFETWYYFIRYQGNEEALQHLNRQLEKVEEMVVLDDLSTFDLDLEHLVSERTAKEMTKLELNSVMFHRKFDGKLKMIDLGLKSRMSNDEMLCQLFETLSMGMIEEYITDEDIDPEDLLDENELAELENEDEDDLDDSSSDSNDDSTESEDEPPPLPKRGKQPLSRDKFDQMVSEKQRQIKQQQSQPLPSYQKGKEPRVPPKKK